MVKELVENALDAGARRIEIEVLSAGRELIAVSDDGCGIPAEEVPLALARHATSKLERAQDLFAIRTLGFRGEALASIAAVSRLELVSRTAQDDRGTRVQVEGGEAGAAQPIGAPVGTAVRVRDLFFNVPARLKFLKSDNTERRRITEWVTRYALAYPRVSFRLRLDGRERFYSPGQGDRREVLAALFGAQAAREMLALPEEPTASIRVTGFVSPPSVSRSNRRGLTFFVNGRWVQDPSLVAAVTQAYRALLMVGRYPMAVLFIDVPPEAVDVNVHPAKAEVRFREPEAVLTVVQRTVRATLLGQATPPAMDLGRSWAEGWRHETAGVPGPDWQAAHAALRNLPQPMPLQLHPRPGSEGGMPLLRAVGQVGGTYLVAEGPDGLYLIDQHAAHERVLFERLMAQRQEGSLECQALLEPETVSLSHEQAQSLESQLDALRALGFDVEPFGGSTFRVRAIPQILSALSPVQALWTLVEDFEEDESPLAEEVEARIAARVCKRAAIKAGQVLALAEQQQLLRDLEACSSPRTCPHGRPTMIHLSVESLERQFGRRG